MKCKTVSLCNEIIKRSIQFC